VPKEIEQSTFTFKPVALPSRIDQKQRLYQLPPRLFQCSEENVDGPTGEPVMFSGGQLINWLQNAVRNDVGIYTTDGCAIVADIVEIKVTLKGV